MSKSDEQAVTNTGEETTPTASPADEPTTQAQEQPTETSVESQATETQPETEAPKEGGDETQGEQQNINKTPSPKSVNRFQELANEVREANLKLEKERAEREQLQRQLMGLQPNQQFQIEPGKEYEVDELNQMIEQAKLAGNQEAIAAFNDRLARLEAEKATENFVSKLESEASELAREFPQLDEKSDQYNPKIHQELTEAYREAAILPDGTVNPALSLKSFGERFMKGAQILAEEKSAEVGEQVAKTASASVKSDTVSTQPQTIDENWFATQYDPDNPEHKKIADEYVARKMNG